MINRRHRMEPLVAGAVVLALVGVHVARAVEVRDDSAALALDTHLGEVAWPDEDALAQETAEALRAATRDLYAEGEARRDAHPKAHGCVHADFDVEATLPAELARGVFVPGSAFRAWIRFSNGHVNPARHDVRGDARGMAIKLTGVPGEKVLASEATATTQDFVLITHPTFFADDPARYATLIRRGTSKNPLVAATAPLALGWKGARIAAEIVDTQIASPLETRYWSAVPSRLGTGPDRIAVKYSARPCEPGGATIPRDPERDYLRDAMVARLAAGPACFDFLVQARTDDAMSVEDSRIEWTEAEAPFVKVATITIPQQTFDTPEQNAFCEDLSFTPWHTLATHRPLGGMNRVRGVVYESLSELRHSMNGTVPREPTGAERFADAPVVDE